MLKNQQYTIAFSILVGLALVAASIFLSERSFGSVPILAVLQGKASGSVSIERVNKDARIIYGDPKAKTKIVEFADFQCPYCSELHGTLKQLVDESNGSIQWEYRHFPLPIHPNALPSAHYAECVVTLAGDTAFWKYADLLMTHQDSLTTDFLASSAKSVGVDPSKLASCLDNTAVQSQVTTDMQTAQNLGGSGTPFSVVIFPDGTTKQVAGALPYMQWRSILNSHT